MDGTTDSDEPNSEPVASVLIASMPGFLDYCQYALGRDRLKIQAECQLSRAEDREVFLACWALAQRWLAWRRDVSGVCDS